MHRSHFLAITCCACLTAGEAAQAADLPTAINTVVGALEQAWKTDPRTSGLAFPAITTVPEASRPKHLCPQERFSAPQTLALYCPDQGRILIDRQRLEGLATQYGSWDMGVWLATALGQALTTSSGQSSNQMRVVAANLQAFCLGGTLLGQAPGLRPPATRSPFSAAFTAFPARLNAQQGTPAQRSYALFTGLGGTASDCDTAAMSSLAVDVVPDPERLRALALNHDRSSSEGAIGDVINALCLPKPPLGCPRRLPPASARFNP